jgi:hypothetical protein
LNILLGLDAGDFRQGVSAAVDEVLRLRKNVRLISKEERVSRATVRAAIREQLAQDREAAQAAKQQQREALRQSTLNNRLNAQLDAQAARERVQAARQKVRDDTRQHRDESGLIRDNLRQAREAAREAARADQQRRQSLQNVSRGIGSVGNAAASAAGAVREMLTFAGSRVASGVAASFQGIAQAIGSIIGPTERVGQTVSNVVGGLGMALGKGLGAVGDLLGTTISMVGTVAGKLVGGLLNLIPLVGPALAGIANALGGIVSAAGAALGAVARVLGEIIGGFAQLGGEILGGVVSALVNVGTMAVVTAARFEQMELAFAGMLGSADRAKAVLDDLFQFAAVTPFSFAGVTQATQRLLAFGFSAENAVGIMKRMADVAAAMPEGIDEGLKRVTRAIGEMQAKGRVSAQEMRQLADAGLPVWDALARHLSTGQRPVGAGRHRVPAEPLRALRGHGGQTRPVHARPVQHAQGQRKPRAA